VVNLPNTAQESVSVDRRSTTDLRPFDASSSAAAIGRHWRTAAWFGVAAYVMSAPLTPLASILPSGSIARGAILAAIPAIGIIWLRVVSSNRHHISMDLVTQLAVVLVVWEAISIKLNVGDGYLYHLVPGALLLLLALVARGPISQMSLADMRIAITKLVSPSFCLLLLGLVAQVAKLNPSIYPFSFVFSIGGYRLQGLSESANLWGFLGALIAVLSFLATSGRLVWIARIAAVLTVLASDSRTSIIVLVIGLATVWLLSLELSVGKRFFVLTFLMTAVLASWGLVDIKRAANSDVLSGRNLIWHELLPYLHDLSIFGHGPVFLQGLSTLVYGPYGSGFYVDAQNQWLSDAIMFGFVGAIITSILLVIMAVHGPLWYRKTIILPLLLMLVVECFSEVPIGIWNGIPGAFPIFIIVMLVPIVRVRRAEPIRRNHLTGRSNRRH
jgi:O-antigen ligase/polysaccharide polymerase Wzy-like membrane protein